MSFETTQPSDAGPTRLRTTRQGRGPTIVLVHGFTQTGASWRGVARELERDYEVVIPDLPGHGRSPMPEPGSGLTQVAEALGEACGEAAYIGYSLGGRCCLHLALRAPRLVERLVIVGAHPGISKQSARRLRRAQDEARAAMLEQGGDSIVPEFLETWLSGPLFAHLTEEQADRPPRLSNSASGLAASLRTAGTGTQLPLWERLCELEMPVLVVTGALDHKFGPLGLRTVEAIGHNARLVVVEGAGHAVCFERPDAFVKLVRDFLAESA
jgi:2-succinyl-6-hydroxy-2,4-cyclohexadiene-1-carboxylate synthase